MKKFIALTILFSLCLCYLYGCTNNSTPTAVGKNIDKNLTSLYNTVSNLDTIDNSYIANPDIYEIENTSKTNVISRSIALPERKEAKEIKIDEVEITTEDNSNSENNVIYTLTDENEETGNLENVDDENLNNNVENNLDESTIEENKTENNEDDLQQTNINEEDNSTLIQNEENTELKQEENIESNKTNVDVIFEDDIDSNTELNDVLIIDENGDGTLIDENGTSENENIPQETLDEIFNNTINDEEMSSDEKERVYVFLFDKIRYVPRYASNYNTDIAQNTLNNYLYKVQELYTMTADVVEANNILSDEKTELLNCIENLKTINNKMINGEIVPNNQQLIALNNYVQDIKTTIKRIKASNGQLNNEINNISTISSNYGLSKSVDIINSNYLKILNHIDARITYFKSALATLNQIDYILKEAQLQINYNFEDTNQSTESSNLTNSNISKTNIDTYKNANNVTTETNNTENENNLNNQKTTNIDTFKKENKNVKNNQNAMVNDNNNIDNTNNLYNNELNNQNNVNSNVPNGIAINNNLPIYGDDVNAPNGTFQNGIITQNNLNNGTNNGVNGNGSGYANGNGYVDYYKQNNFQRTDKNINTYGKNTLIDMINNGTVNNGINTLNMYSDSKKPVMVDGNAGSNISDVSTMETIEDITNDEELNDENSDNDDTNNLNENNKNLLDNEEDEDLINNKLVEQNLNETENSANIQTNAESEIAIEENEKNNIDENLNSDEVNDIEQDKNIDEDEIVEDKLFEDEKDLEEIIDDEPDSNDEKISA